MALSMMIDKEISISTFITERILGFAIITLFAKELVLAELNFFN